MRLSDFLTKYKRERGKRNKVKRRVEKKGVLSAKKKIIKHLGFWTFVNLLVVTKRKVYK